MQRISYGQTLNCNRRVCIEVVFGRRRTVAETVHEGDLPTHDALGAIITQPIILFSST